MMIQVTDLRVRYGTGRSALTAVDGVSFSVEAGHTLGIVGESGCGKSTLARAVAGLLDACGGKILLEGQDVTPLAKRNTLAYHKQVQMVFQDPYSSLNPRLTVHDMLDEVLRRSGIRGRSARRTAALELLDLVDLPGNSMTRYPHQFSGGQRQRIAIARALALKPRIIINDEVTSSLDVSAQGKILNLLRDLQRELKLTYVFISHDLSAVRYMSDEVGVMYLGRIVEHVPVDELLDRAYHPYTEALIRSVPSFDSRRDASPLQGELPNPRTPPPGCRFASRCPVGPNVFPERQDCVTVDPQLAAHTKPHKTACHYAPVPALRRTHAIKE